MTIEQAIEIVETAARESDRKFYTTMIDLWADDLEPTFRGEKPPTVPDALDALDLDALCELYEAIRRWKDEQDPGGLSSEDWEAIDGHEGFDSGVALAIMALREAGGAA